jgi:hypothetical protein
VARIVYVGPHRDGVEISLPFGGYLNCEQNKPVDVPDSLAPSLLEQDTNWQPASKPRGRADERSSA